MTLSKVSQVAGEKGPLHVPAHDSGLSKGLGTARFSGQGVFLEPDLLRFKSRPPSAHGVVSGRLYINTRPPVLSDHELSLALSQLHMKLMQT